MGVWLCQGRGPENDWAFLTGGAHDRSGPQAFLTCSPAVGFVGCPGIRCIRPRPQGRATDCHGPACLCTFYGLLGVRSHGFQCWVLGLLPQWVYPHPPSSLCLGTSSLVPFRGPHVTPWL